MWRSCHRVVPWRLSVSWLFIWTKQTLQNQIRGLIQLSFKTVGISNDYMGFSVFGRFIFDLTGVRLGILPAALSLI